MTQANNPLHGIKLADLLDDLVEYYGWKELGERINIRCFNHDPSIKSSLKFLRKTPWAREKVEHLYLKMNHLPVPATQFAQTGDNDRLPTKRHEKRDNKKQQTTEKQSNNSSVNAHIWQR